VSPIKNPINMHQKPKTTIPNNLSFLDFASQIINANIKRKVNKEPYIGY